MSQSAQKSIPQKFNTATVEIVMHFIAAGFLTVGLWGGVAHHHLNIFLGIIFTVNSFRLLTHFTVQHSVELSTDKAIDPAFLLGNVSIGLVWGFTPIFFISLYPETIAFFSLYFAVIACATMATFAGSPLQPKLFIAFATPALLIPLLWSLFQYETKYSAVWGLLTIMSVLMIWVSRRLNNLFKRYRLLSIQNTDFLTRSVATRDEAIYSQQEIENYNESLKSKIEEVEQAKEKLKISEQETNTILQDMQDTFFRTNNAGQIIRISPSVSYLLGYTINELVGLNWAYLFIHKTDHSTFLNALRDKFVGLQNYETQLKHSSGHSIWVSINAHYYNDGKGIKAGFEGTARDVTDKRMAAEILFQEKERLHVTLESIADGVITTNAKGAVEYLNPNAEAMTGWIEKMAIGKPLATVFNLIDESKKIPVSLPMKKWLTEGRRIALNHPAALVNKASNREFAIELTGAPIKDSGGVVIGSVLVFRNVTKLRNLATQLSHQATHDALTGLINRTEFENRANLAVHSAQKNDKLHSLLYIDLDQFKIVNDTCGHHAGDELLKQITAQMQEILRNTDTLARLGGDEFGVLLLGCPLEKAANIAQTLRRKVEEFRFVWDNQVFKIGASIGLVMIESTTTGLTQLLSSADSACYVAKERGRNQVHIYQPDDRAIAQQHGQMQWMQRIHLAIDQNQFELHFQSIVAIDNPSSGKLNGEFLLRMVDDQNMQPDGLILPNAFIPAAERYHLMPQIDRWVIKHTLYAMASKNNRINQYDICFINLSGQSLSDLKLLNFVIEMMDETNVSPENLCFEITESAVIANVEIAKQFISRLKELGCKFALDNFGSGLSSFSYLKNLPVDFLKLDGALIKNIVDDKISYAMVESINKIAHIMGMKTIAEYVETEEILQALKEISIDHAQGYWIERPRFFAKPKNIDEDKVSCA